MSTTPLGSSSPVLNEVIGDILPFFERLDTGKYAVALGGSRSKALWDERSDIDFRLYHETPLPKPHAASPTWRDYFQIIDQWAERGVVIDGIWSRTIANVELQLNAWLSGDITPEPIVWTIWGYHLLPDVASQLAIVDPYGVIASWHERLATYPEAVKTALVAKHLSSLRYWRKDYHYRHKVERRDTVFLASLSARLAHDLIQVICAINRVPYPGDGNNLRIVENLPILPEAFARRIVAALYPVDGERMYQDQRDLLVSLIDDVERLADTHL